MKRDDRIDFDDQALRRFRDAQLESKLDDAFWTKLTHRCHALTAYERAAGIYNYKSPSGILKGDINHG